MPDPSPIDLVFQSLLQESELQREQMITVELNKFSQLLLIKTKGELEDIRLYLVSNIQKKYQLKQIVKVGLQMIALVDGQLRKLEE